MSIRRRLASALVCAALLAVAAVPPPGALAAGAGVVWAVGDGADGGANGRAVADLIGSGRIDRFVYLGDVYQRGTASEFRLNYEPLFGRFNPIAAPVIGNHEWANRATGYLPYWRVARGGTEMPLRYALVVGGWQLIALDSSTPADEAQLRFLERRLRPSRFGNCRIGIVHNPRWSAGPNHGDDPAQQPLWSRLRGRARLVLAGHEHNMQRMRPSKGTRLLISGAGGKNLAPPSPGYRRAAFTDAGHYGALRLALRPGRAVAQFVAVGGQVLDRSVTRCDRGRDAYPR